MKNLKEELLKLDVVQLSRYCQTNLEARKIIEDDKFWFDKIEKLGYPPMLFPGCKTFKESYFRYLECLFVYK